MTRPTGTPVTAADYLANAVLDAEAALDMSRRDDALRNRKLPTVRTQRIEACLRSLTTAAKLQAEIGDAA